MYESRTIKGLGCFGLFLEWLTLEIKSWEETIIPLSLTAVMIVCPLNVGDVPRRISTIPWRPMQSSQGQHCWHLCHDLCPSLFLSINIRVFFSAWEAAAAAPGCTGSCQTSKHTYTNRAIRANATCIGFRKKKDNYSEAIYIWCGSPKMNCNHGDGWKNKK